MSSPRKENMTTCKQMNNGGGNFKNNAEDDLTSEPKSPCIVVGRSGHMLYKTIK